MSPELLPYAVDGIALLVLVEALALYVWRRRWFAAVAATLGSGLGLLLALRFALSSASATWIAGALLLAGIAHAVDLLRRTAGER